MKTFYFLEKEDLRQVIAEIFAEQQQPKTVAPTEKPEHLSMDELPNYLQSKGVRLSKSTLYKLTAKNEIPYKRFGERKLLFAPSAIDAWAEQRISERN